MNVYQQAKAKVPAIDNRKVKAELLYNQLDLFFWCRLAYLILGGILLFIACGEIIADFKWGRKISSILIALLAIAFLTHTAGVLLRWYICGHAPWANAYESMVCTSWMLVGSGLLFARRFRILPALAGLLGGIMLFCSRTEPPESGNHSFGTCSSILLADVSRRYHYDRLRLFCSLCADRVV